MKKFLAMLLSFVMLFSLASCGGTPVEGSGDASGSNASAGSTVQKIIDRGYLIVGVKEDVPGFGLRNTETNEIEGFEIEIIKIIAKSILGDETKYELTPVTAKTRGPLLDNGDVDMIIATFTVTAERRETYDFSTPYYKDSVGFLVKTAAGFTTFADMDGKIIGVAQSATSKDAVEAEAESLGISISFQEYATYPEVKVALDSGRVDAFSVDKSILAGYLDDTTEILPDSLAPQEYAIATRKSDPAFSELIDGLIVQWAADGTLAELIATWGLGE